MKNFIFRCPRIDDGTKNVFKISEINDHLKDIARESPATFVIDWDVLEKKIGTRANCTFPGSSGLENFGPRQTQPKTCAG